jgi:hypothetical protein
MRAAVFTANLKMACSDILQFVGIKSLANYAKREVRKVITFPVGSEVSALGVKGGKCDD